MTTKDEALIAARKALVDSIGYHHLNDEDIYEVLPIIDAALANKGPLTKDYTAEDLQNALDRGREIGRREALEEPEQELEMEDGPELLPVAKIYEWGMEGPRLQGLTNDWPPVGTILFAMKWNS